MIYNPNQTALAEALYLALAADVRHANQQIARRIAEEHDDDDGAYPADEMLTTLNAGAP